MVFALETVPLGGLVEAGLIAALPGAVGDLRPWLRCMVPRLDADAVKELGIDRHQS
jgi:hypothetical protein